MSRRITENQRWRHWVTPRNAREAAIHRWFLFPHSFTGELVHALIDEWHLDQHDRILDPFVGSGTTLLAAKEKGISCDGYDLSPLAVWAANTKTASYSRTQLLEAWHTIESKLRHDGGSPTDRPYPDLVCRALSGGRLDAFHGIAKAIEGSGCSSSEQSLFRLALMAILPRFSHAVANGGWLRWSNQAEAPDKLTGCFKKRVEMMLSDVAQTSFAGEGQWTASVADARVMPALTGTYSAVITSPPYPNRHDYTRVFGVELMFAFHSWEEVRALRHQTFHSHPEARPKRPEAKGYRAPKGLGKCVRGVGDTRIKRMLEGYFLDMYLCLSEVARVSRGGARVAVVVGNAQYSGRPVVVDEFTAEVGEQAGLKCTEIRTVRWRGNSAQQMGKHGRNPSRESVVIFEKD